MKKHLKEFAHNQKGYSLVELIIVIAIMAVLVSMSMAMGTYIKKARRSRDVNTASEIATVVKTAAVLEENQNAIENLTSAGKVVLDMTNVLTNHNNNEFYGDIYSNLGAPYPQKTKYDKVSFIAVYDTNTGLVNVYGGTQDADHMLYPEVGSHYKK